MDARLSSQLVVAALEMAYAQRCPDDVIHHSDHGGEYTAVAFSTRCWELGVTRSMGSVGDCFDNAMMESFFSSLEAEVLDRYRFSTRDEARREIFSWLGGITGIVVIAGSAMFPHESSSDDSVTSVRVVLTRFSRIRGKTASR